LKNPASFLGSAIFLDRQLYPASSVLKEIPVMPRVADFVQFSDVSFDLRIGGDIDRPLTQLISDAPANGEGALLTWNVRREGSGSVTYEVKVNGSSAPTSTVYTVSQPDWSTVQETIPTNVVKQGSNTVEFRVTGGSGTLSIGDVVLWYRQNV
jgi:hypothetical protein